MSLVWILSLLISPVFASGGLPVQVPEACLAGRIFPCALQTEGQWPLPPTEAGLHEGGALSAGSQLLMLSATEFQLVRGRLWIKLNGKTQVRFGSLRFAGVGDFYFGREQDRLVVRNLSGQIHISGGPIDYPEIPSGFENWFEGMSRQLVVRSGVPKASDPQGLIRDWLLIWGRRGLEGELKELVFSYRALQRKALAEESNLYHKAFEIRRLAQESEEKAKLAQFQKSEAEKQRLRQMFRQRYFSPEVTSD